MSIKEEFDKEREERLSGLLPGKLAVVEAIDGGGKDTVIDRLVEEEGFIKARLPVYDTPTGQLLRNWIDTGKEDVSEDVFQAVMVANYIEAFERDVLPALREGKNVAMSRFAWSMSAYSSQFDASPEFIYDLRKAVEHYLDEAGVLSEIFYLRIPVATSLERIAIRDAETDQKREDVFENKETLTAVHSSYENEVKAPGCEIDARGTKDEVYEMARNRIMDFINE